MSSNNLITLVVTSANRHDLLQRTLSTLSSTIRTPFAETIIVEDSDTPALAFLSQIKCLGNITWINSPKRMLQLWCADKLWQQVKTEFVMWCEDDWQFNGPFLEESLAILKQYPEILTVNLRGAFSNGHPLIKDPAYPFQILRPGHKHFGCFAFNPGLRRLSDYKRIGTYGKYCGYQHFGVGSEQTLSDLYQSLGYKIASLPPDDKETITHLGQNRSRAKERIPPTEKILIAVAACHQYRYGSRTSPIHYDTQPLRIDAQRKTWLQDVAVHSHYMDYKFFYGKGDGQPKTDEVFLDCGDTYEDLPYKVKEICRYALQHGYDFVYKCDDDTFCRLDRLMLSDFRNFDQYGFKKDGESNYVTGGCGYTLSRAAMTAIVAEQPNHWAEDLWVGSVMRKHGLKRGADELFIPGFEHHYVDITTLPEDYIACHAVKPDDMEKLTDKKPSKLKEHSPKKLPLPTPQPTKQASFVVHLSSGLGNQIFMYAFGEGLAAKTRQSVAYHWEEKVREYGLDRFVDITFVPKSGTEFKEPHLLYNPDIYKLHNAYLTGCWQNEKYFSHIADKIRETFTQSIPALADLANKLSAPNAVAVGVRRGDYLRPYAAKFHGNLDKPYYSNAYQTIRQRVPDAQFYIFSDDPDWCSKNLEGEVIPGDQYEHLHLFSKCPSAIIPNSTFHWWGAWLGKAPLVVAPRQWFKAGVDIDIVPERWITIDSLYSETNSCSGKL